MEQWSSWLLGVLSIPALRAIDFGVGLGALAMGLRVWLGIAGDGDEGGLALMRRIYDRCGPSTPDDLRKDFTLLELLGHRSDRNG